MKTWRRKVFLSDGPKRLRPVVTPQRRFNQKVKAIVPRAMLLEQIARLVLYRMIRKREYVLLRG